MVRQAERPVIVAGVDGSEDSKEALRWAAAEARRIGAEVHAVIAWDVPVSIFFVPSYTEDDYRHDAEGILRTVLAEVLGDDQEVPVVARTVKNRPAIALIEEAADAELLVVGSHGHSKFPGVHLGSVVSSCIQHAPCPVVVICHTRRRPGLSTAPGSLTGSRG